MEGKTPYIYRVPPKKSHWVKILAPGRNRTPKTYVNQKYHKLDYIRHFHVIPKFPLTIMRRSGAGFYEIRTILTISERIGSHEFCGEQTESFKLDHTTHVVNVSHRKLHIVTDTKVTWKFLKKGTLALSLSHLWPGIVVRGNSGQKIGDLEISGIVEMKLFFVERGH